MTHAVLWVLGLGFSWVWGSFGICVFCIYGRVWVIADRTSAGVGRCSSAQFQVSASNGDVEFDGFRRAALTYA